MDSAYGVCEVCGQSEFTLEDGFYYCNECGTKLQSKREFIQNDDTPTVSRSTRLKQEEASDNKITSWEQMNYILYGLTERLIEMGAPVELKTTVLQIWCSYLRLTEVAFFSKKQRLRPRLSLYNQRCDLKLLFNRNVPKSSYKGKKKKSTGDISTVRAKKKLNQMLLEEEHNAQSQYSDLESTLSTLSSSLHDSNNDNTPLSFRFNSRARKRLLSEMHISEEHIEWHEHEAPIDAPCHSFTSLHPKNRVSERRSDNWSSVCRKSVIVSILALALNQVRSLIQLGDILRWIEEGHLLLDDAKHFLPGELDPACYSETVCKLSFHIIAEGEEIVSLLTRDLGMVPVEPDLIALCRRYLGELALPLDLEPYIAKLIAIGPAIKQGTAGTYYPSYEQHAMKYILFIMKLLFGLDGVVERKLDDSSEKVNDQLVEAAVGHPKLFVWHEWQQYVAMRHTILEQLHYPTNQQRAKMMLSGPVNSDLFLDFASSSVIPDDDNTTGYRAALTGSIHGPCEERRFRNIHSVIVTATEKRPKVLEEPSKKHISFDHSLQPQRSYMATVLEMEEANRSGVYIPDYMKTDHCKRIVGPFINPTSLKRYLLVHHRVRLITKTIMPTTSHIRMENVHQNKANSEVYLRSNEFTKVLQIDTSESSDTDESECENNILDYIDARAETKLSSRDTLLHKVISRNALDHLQYELMASVEDAEKLMGKNDCTDENPFKNNPPIKVTLPGEEHCNKNVQIALSNFHYWVRSIPSLYSAREVFKHEYFNAFPPSFQFLLREAAYVIRCSPYDLYRTLDELEKYVFKRYQAIK